MKMLFWLGIGAGVLVAVVIVVVGIGYALPADHVARGSAEIAAPPGRVAALVRAVEKQPQWRRGVTAIEIVARVGNRIDYVETSDGDRIAFRFEEAAEGRFASTITDDTLPFGGGWTIEVTPAGAGSRATIEERGTVRHPVYRFFSKFVFGHEKTLTDYLADLKAAVEAR